MLWTMLAWIVTRSDKSRLGGSNWNCRLPASNIYTHRVHADLSSNGEQIGLDQGFGRHTKAQDWETQMAQHACNVDAQAYFQRGASSSVVDILTSRDRESVDYWLKSPYCNNQMTRLQVVDVVALEHHKALTTAKGVFSIK